MVSFYINGKLLGRFSFSETTAVTLSVSPTIHGKFLYKWKVTVFIVPLHFFAVRPPDGVPLGLFDSPPPPRHPVAVAHHNLA
ncbi:hypothetical protein RchiOBHm_Chr7g0220261 [Rosa chinensis]|uniref:Uncharacterized protein n=1 Tax=Rosa chinensis TaxID=74649 RepID=A0A2P6PCR2_ROSCH|nr:hypothetical protein RchiOBHm_Chr7g0220261 [Rosa chinensis]